MAVNPNVPYAGHLVPKDKKAPVTPVPDPNVPYAGSILPRNARTPQQFLDQFNTPGIISFNNGVQEITMPPDTIIYPEFEKRLAMDYILDGPSVFERIQTKPTHLEFRGTFRMQDIDGTRYNNTKPPPGSLGIINNVFPQEFINDWHNYTWLPNTILVVKNSLLNGIGIQQVIVEKASLEPAPGNKNVGYRLTAWENVPGQSLIIG